MKVLNDLCEVLEDELKEIVRAGEISSPQVLDNTYKAIDILKDIKTIEAMENAYGGNSYMGGSYMPYYDDDYSMARGGRMPHYNRSMNRGDYSRDDDKEHLMKEMEKMRQQLEQMQR